jgi:hypothetical protein
MVVLRPLAEDVRRLAEREHERPDARIAADQVSLYADQE